MSSLLNSFVVSLSLYSLLALVVLLMVIIIIIVYILKPHYFKSWMRYLLCFCFDFPFLYVRGDVTVRCILEVESIAKEISRNNFWTQRDDIPHRDATSSERNKVMGMDFAMLHCRILKSCPSLYESESNLLEKQSICRAVTNTTPASLDQCKHQSKRIKTKSCDIKKQTHSIYHDANFTTLELQSTKKTHIFFTNNILCTILSQIFRTRSYNSKHNYPLEREYIYEDDNKEDDEHKMLIISKNTEPHYNIKKDGYLFAMEWYPHTPRKSDMEQKGFTILFVMHGICGHSKTSYIQRIISLFHRFNQENIKHNQEPKKIFICVKLRRGCGDLSIKDCYLGNDASQVHDIELAMRRIDDMLKGIDGKKNVITIGYSFGGMLLTRYLATRFKHTQFHHLNFIGNILVAVPFCLYEMKNQLKKFPYTIVNRLQTKYCVQQFLVKHKEKILKNPNINYERALKCTSVDEWDYHVTIRAHVVQYDSAERYDQQANPKRFLQHINIPSLVINAHDDFTSSKHILEPLSQYNQNPNLIFVQTTYGSHGIFCDNLTSHLRAHSALEDRNKDDTQHYEHTTWLDRCIFEYVSALLS